MLLFMLSFTIFTSVVMFNKPLSTFTRAKEDTVPTGKNSILFAWPLTVKADGKTESTVNVFVRTATDKPLSGKKVSLQTNIGTVREVNSQTDKSGKAVFALSSTTSGVADLTAIIEGSISVSQRVSVKFE